MEAWRCGVAFEEVFKELPPGEWEPWLKSKGISKSTADRLRLLANSYDNVRQVDEFTSVDQALRAARSKRKGPVEEVKPEVETQGETSPGKPEEAIGGEDPRQLPDDTQSAQEILELPDKARGTEDQLPVGEKELAKLRQENTKLRQEKTVLLKKIERLQRLLEENGISWESTPDDQQQIYPNRAFGVVNSENPDSDRVRTEPAP